MTVAAAQAYDSAREFGRDAVLWAGDIDAGNRRRFCAKRRCHFDPDHANQNDLLVGRLRRECLTEGPRRQHPFHTESPHHALHAKKSGASRPDSSARCYFHTRRRGGAPARPSVTRLFCLKEEPRADEKTRERR